MDKFNKENWEQEFDSEYGTDNIIAWTLGIVVSAMVHAQNRPITADGSYITVKLRKLVESAITKAKHDAFDEAAKIAESWNEATKVIAKEIRSLKEVKTNGH